MPSPADADDLHALLRVDDHPDALAEEVLVVDEQHPDRRRLGHGLTVRTGTHAVVVNVAPSGLVATSYVEATAARLQPAAHALETRPSPIGTGSASTASGWVSSVGAARVAGEAVAHLDAQLARPRAVGPVPLDEDRLVAAAVPDRVGEHLLEHPVGDHLELRRQRLRRCRARARRPRGRWRGRPRPACRAAGAARRRAAPAAAVSTWRTSCSEERAEVAMVAIVCLSFSVSASGRYCADSACARITASEWPTTSCTSRASRAWSSRRWAISWACAASRWARAASAAAATCALLGALRAGRRTAPPARRTTAPPSTSMPSTPAPTKTLSPKR